MRFVSLRQPFSGTGFLVGEQIYAASKAHVLSDLEGWPWPAGPQQIVRTHGLLDALVRHPALGEPIGDLTSVDLGPPVSDSVHLLFAGLNYRDHAAEIGAPIPQRPHVFAKLRGSQSGPRDPIVIPPQSSKVDHEVELAVVVKSSLSNASPAEARDAIAGFLVVNDVSARDWQFADDQQLVLGKGFRTFCPCGPALVTPDEIADLDAAELTCTVNGEVRQRSTVAELIFGVDELLSFLSHIVDLQSGDIVSTGTPAGVEQGRSDPRWLQPGDIVECAIEGIGTLINRVEEAAP